MAEVDDVDRGRIGVGAAVGIEDDACALVDNHGDDLDIGLVGYVGWKSEGVGIGMWGVCLDSEWYAASLSVD